MEEINKMFDGWLVGTPDAEGSEVKGLEVWVRVAGHDIEISSLLTLKQAADVEAEYLEEYQPPEGDGDANYDNWKEETNNGKGW